MIKGYSDQRRLPRLGKIRLGEKRKNASEKEYPVALDHFNFADAPEVAKVYGDNCKELDVILPVEDTDVFFRQARIAYTKSGWWCRSDDGETAFRVRRGPSDGAGRIPKGQPLDPFGEKFIGEQKLDVPVGTIFPLPCAGDECPYAKAPAKDCRPIARLLVLLPKVPLLGCWQITTSSWNSMVRLNSYIDVVRNIAGRVSMIPLTLRLVEHEAAPDGKKKKVHVLELYFPGSPDQLRNTAAKLSAPMPRTALPAPGEIDEDVPEDLVSATVLETGEPKAARPAIEPPKRKAANEAKPAAAEANAPAAEPKQEELPGPAQSKAFRATFRIRKANPIQKPKGKDGPPWWMYSEAGDGYELRTKALLDAAIEGAKDAVAVDVAWTMEKTARVVQSIEPDLNA